MNFLKAIIFYPMMWLRKIFLAIGKMLSVLFFVMAIFVLVVGLNGEDGVHWSLLLPVTFLSFSSFLLTQFYDQVLIRLNPTGQDLYLMQ